MYCEYYRINVFFFTSVRFSAGFVIIEDTLLQFISAWRAAELHAPDVGPKELSPGSFNHAGKLISYTC